MKQITEKNVKSVELLPYDQGEDQLKGHLSGSVFEEAPDIINVWLLLQHVFISQHSLTNKNN